MWDTIVYSFIALAVIVDPIGTAVLFAGMTAGSGEPHRKRMAIRAVVLAGILLAAFAFAGELLLGIMGIGLPAFRIAGGILLFMLATDMVLARQTGLRSLTSMEDEEAESRADISVFPLAFPLIAGPGAMTSIVLLMGRTENDPARVLAVFAVLAVVLALTLALLLMGEKLRAALGVTGGNVISRVLGIVLAALAVQFVLDGLAAWLPI